MGANYVRVTILEQDILFSGDCMIRQQKTLTSLIVECAHGTWELHIISGAWRAVVTGWTQAGVVEHHRGDGVITEVAGWTLLAGALPNLVLVRPVLTDLRLKASHDAKVSHGAAVSTEQGKTIFVKWLIAQCRTKSH